MPPALAQNPVLRSLLWWSVVFLVVLLPLSSVVLAWRMVLPPSDCSQSATATRSGSVEYFCFPLLRPHYGQGTITAGADGNLWFTEERKIARVTPSGVLTEFSAEFPSGPIITGPDRSTWFTEMAPQGGYKLVRMSVRGEREVFAENQLDTSSALLVGPDGNLWIGEARSITKVSPTGEISTFSLPSPSQAVPGADHGFGIMALTSGADGNLWFVENITFADPPAIQGALLGRIALSGVISEFPVVLDRGPAPSLGGGIGWRRSVLTSGPDGNLWFLGYDGQVSRITPKGVITHVQVPEQTIQETPAIIAGADGNLWFSTGVGKIGRVTPSGVVTLFPLSPQARIGGLASGPDGRIWFLRADNTLSGSIWWVQIGRITL